MMTPPPVTPPQPKNIHINPHFKGAVVTPVQGTCLPAAVKARLLWPKDSVASGRLPRHSDTCCLPGPPFPKKCLSLLRIGWGALS